MIRGIPVDLDACPNRRYGRNPCGCEDKCAMCGWGKHMSVHGGVVDHPGMVYGHEFVSRRSVASTNGKAP